MACLACLACQATYKAIHTSDEVKNLSLRLPETDIAVHDAGYGTSKDCVHSDLLGDDTELNTYLILSERHVDEYTSDKNEHYAQNSER